MLGLRSLGRLSRGVVVVGTGPGRRSIALSAVANIKQIKRREEGNKIIVEAEYKPSPREKYLVPSAKEAVTALEDPSSTAPSCACPLCRLGLYIQHTDVLILNQFVDSKGKQIPRNITGLCYLQHRRMDYLLVMAEKAGLMERSTQSTEPGKNKELMGWESLDLNKYYDENVIEEFVYHKTRRNRA